LLEHGCSPLSSGKPQRHVTTGRATALFAESTKKIEALYKWSNRRDNTIRSNRPDKMHR
jgi:hypothetical protein